MKTESGQNKTHLVSSPINWYPGHMTKARRAMEEDLKLVDMILEIRDARIPYASLNPDIGELGRGKRRLILLNKADLADEALTAKWIEALSRQNVTAAAADSRSTAGVKAVRRLLDQLSEEKAKKDKARGIVNRPARIMVAGIPNVGKSTLINSLAGRASAKTGDKPGVTRGNQWIRLGKSLELLDTPGILWPKFEDPAVGIHLALTGSINDDILPAEDLAAEGLVIIGKRYPQSLAGKYGELPDDPYEALVHIAVLRKLLKKGGEPDTEKAVARFLDDLRKGRLGRVTLEDAPDREEMKHDG